MPRGDRTGPSGEGPMTGRGLGLCSGSDTPGFVKNPGSRIPVRSTAPRNINPGNFQNSQMRGIPKGGGNFSRGMRGGRGRSRGSMKRRGRGRGRGRRR